ncbi:MAG: hypothetical protein SVT56_12670, partial [Chloroflexota bacterium]|nr:hypothetical protein [Chloroflexota bacterium]
AKTYKSSYALGVAREIYLAIRTAFGKEIISLDRIAHFFRVFSWRKKFYSYLLSRIKPQYLLVNCAYSNGNHSIVAAAKECRITVIEFQHGILGEHHPGFSWTEYAHPYKHEMPLPDYIFLYGEHWKQRLLMNKFWHTDELRVVGSLRMEQYRQKRRTPRREEKCILTLTTQGIVTENLIEFIAEFLNIAEGQLDFELNLKLHPGEESKALYEASLGDNPHVHILLNKEEPSTFSLLVDSNLHISISSTVHYEAMALGIPTIILPLVEVFEQILQFQEEGAVYVAKTPQELLDIVLCYQEIEITSDIGELLFKRGALENMKKELTMLQPVKSRESFNAT